MKLRFFINKSSCIFVLFVSSLMFSCGEAFMEGELTENAAYEKVMKVLTHPRCMNCHPSGENPRQGEDSHIHHAGVMRGEDDHGLPDLRCDSCHGDHNDNATGIPGSPHWGLAPKSMAWTNLSKAQIAEAILNPATNGGRTLDEVVHHLTEHELVLWAWTPGLNPSGQPREVPPVSKAEFIKSVKEWAEIGFVIPGQTSTSTQPND